MVLGITEIEIASVNYDRKPLTADLAAKLTERFGTTPEFWLDLQSVYNSSVADA